VGQGGGAVDEERDGEDEQGPREDEPNPTQQAIGGGEDRPADVSWREDEWGEKPEGETA
jgi:hypothetical protein